MRNSETLMAVHTTLNNDVVVSRVQKNIKKYDDAQEIKSLCVILFLLMFC